MEGKSGKIFIGDQEVAECRDWTLDTYEWRGDFEKYSPQPIDINWGSDIEIKATTRWWVYFGTGWIEEATAEPSEDGFNINYSLEGKYLIKIFKLKYWIYRYLLKQSDEQIVEIERRV